MMELTSGNTIDKMFEYNLWANIQLIELCRGLSDEQLDVEIEGVFGKIQPTLAHLIRAEDIYINRLTGTNLWSDDLDWEVLSMDDLLEMAQQSGKRLLEIASNVNPEIHYDIERRGEPYRFFNWTVVLQALHHGIEHRAQIKMLLTKLGVPHPELAGWDYTASLSVA